MEGQFTETIREKIAHQLQAPLPELTRRSQTLPRLQGKVWAVIGMRRAGKTSFLHQCRADAIAAGAVPESHLYFNFEDERLAGFRAAELHLVTAMHQRMLADAAIISASGGAHPRTGLYLDEIQLVPGWEGFVRRLLDEGETDVFVSGSSAKLLSREITTGLRGREWEVPIFPFSFREYLRHQGKQAPESLLRMTHRQQLALDADFTRYVKTGGFPEAQSLDLPERRQLLQSYVDVVVLRDVVERHQVSAVTALRWMVRRLLASPASLFSIAKFADDLKSQAIPVARDTLHQLLSHLEDTFLLQSVCVATDSEKRRQVMPRKVYPADPGLIPVFDRSGKENLGLALETSVFNHLQRLRAEVAYVKTQSGFEVDFLARFPDGSQSLIQVCAQIHEPGTLERELRSLPEAAKDFPQARQVLLTGEASALTGAASSLPPGVRCVSAWEWMLETA